MACASPVNNCVTCIALSDQKKPKAGILLCIGCQAYFCSQHIIQHRQQLSEFLENEVVHTRNSLQEQLSTCLEQQWSNAVKTQMECINRWELDTIDRIKQVAERARQQIHDTTTKEHDKLQERLSFLSDEADALRENDSYCQNDITRLLDKFQQLREILENYPVELVISQIGDELITVKSIAETTSPWAPTPCFIDQILATKKPKTSIALSVGEIGRMCPLSNQLIAFYSTEAIATLNIPENSWKSLHINRYFMDNHNEMVWSSYLQKFIVLKYSFRNNYPNNLYQYDPFCGSYTEILKKDSNWNSGAGDNLTAFTCFKNTVLLVLQTMIQKWTITDDAWHAHGKPETEWRPPISCGTDQEIKCIRMNDLHYALILGYL